MTLPFDRGYVILCLVQALAVAAPRRSPTLGFLRARPLFGLIPLAAIGGGVLLLGGIGGAPQRAADLAAIATPLLALAGVAGHRLRLLALAAAPLYLLAWRVDGGRAHDLAVDLLIVGACATLAWLTGAIAPRLALCVGILVATVVDVYQVTVTHDVQPVAQALHVAAPAVGLPRLQEALYHGSTMGWGDVYLAALLGVIFAASPAFVRLTATIAVAIGAVLFGVAFLWLDTIPATVPVAVAMLVALAVEWRQRHRRAGSRPSEDGYPVAIPRAPGQPARTDEEA